MANDAADNTLMALSIAVFLWMSMQMYRLYVYALISLQSKAEFW